MGAPAETLFPKRFRTRYAELLSRGFVSPQRSVVEEPDLHGLHHDGSEFSLEIELSAIDTDRGLMALMSVTDIRGRRHTEEEARVLKDYLDTILFNLPVGVAIL